MRLLLALLVALSWPSVLSEVQKTFDQCSEFFAEKQPPVIPNVLKPKKDDVRYKKICQKSDATYTFATLYNTENRIPVFSAYKYTGIRANILRPEISWKIEPQLDPPVPDMTVPYNNQAINEDYLKNSKLNHGHLFSYGFAADELTGISTFTLTNIVPQYSKFNSGSWNYIERETSKIMDKNCRGENGKILAHVLTGAVPGNNKLNYRVNIPSLMWMAFCCYNTQRKEWVSRAYWAPNEDKIIININRKSLVELQKDLSQKWVKNVKLFKDNCAKKHTR